MDKRKKVLTAIGTVAAVVTLYLIYGHFMYVTTDNAQIEAHTVMLAPRVAGYITKVNIVEGQRVKAGETLVEIDSRDYTNTLQQVRGELASIDARRADAHKNFRRLASLYEKEAISQQQFDQASTSYSDLNAKRESVAAQVAQAELNVENTKIRAPVDGFIAKKSADVGQLAAVGVPLVGFVDGIERWVIANFKETELEGVRPGRKVDVAVDAISGRSFIGSVFSLSAATGATFTLLPPDNATGNFTKVVQRVPVRIKLEQLTPTDIESLRAGLSAYVKVHRR